MAKASKGAPGKGSGAKAHAKGARGAPAAAPAQAPRKVEQLTLDDAAGSESVAAAQAESAPRKAAPEGGPVVELVIGAQGTWKKLASGKKVPIDEREWQLELARMLARKAAAEAPPSGD